MPQLGAASAGRKGPFCSSAARLERLFVILTKMHRVLEVALAGSNFVGSRPSHHYCVSETLLPTLISLGGRRSELSDGGNLEGETRPR